MNLRPLPTALLTQREAARVLLITAPRLARAVKRGAVRPDFVANMANLFLPDTIKMIARKKLFRPITR